MYDNNVDEDNVLMVITKDKHKWLQPTDPNYLPRSR